MFASHVKPKDDLPNELLEKHPFLYRCRDKLV